MHVQPLQRAIYKNVAQQWMHALRAPLSIEMLPAVKWRMGCTNHANGLMDMLLNVPAASRNTKTHKSASATAEGMCFISVLRHWSSASRFSFSTTNSADNWTRHKTAYFGASKLAIYKSYIVPNKILEDNTAILFVRFLSHHLHFWQYRVETGLHSYPDHAHW